MEVMGLDREEMNLTIHYLRKSTKQDRCPAVITICVTFFILCGKRSPFRILPLSKSSISCNMTLQIYQIGRIEQTILSLKGKLEES